MSRASSSDQAGICTKCGGQTNEKSVFCASCGNAVSSAAINLAASQKSKRNIIIGVLSVVVVFAIANLIISHAINSNRLRELDRIRQSSIVYDVLSVYDANFNVIHYGMDRRAAERITGRTVTYSLGRMPIPIYSYYDGISISYRNNRVVLLNITEPGWWLLNGIHIGMQVQDTQTFYGMMVAENREIFYPITLSAEFLAFFFASEEYDDIRLITNLEEIKAIPDDSDDTFVVFLRLIDDIIKGIVIADLQANYDLQASLRVSGDQFVGHMVN